jgi:RNA polymerase sigma factor (sigma-70 family)
MIGRQLPAVVEFLHQVPGPSAEEAADVRLLRRYATLRDEAAFALLVRRHGPMVLGVCRRVLGRSPDVEDAFQATFLVLARRAASLARPGRLANWLYGVAYRTALKARSLAARRRARERSLDGRDCPKPADPVWPDLAAVLDEEISRLPEKYRSAFILCYLQGKTTAEAGKELHCPRGTVLSRLAWARERLRGRLTRRGVALSATALVAALDNEARAIPPVSLLATTCSEIATFTAHPAAGVPTPAAVLAMGVQRSMRFNACKKLAAVTLVLALVVLPLGLLFRPGPGALGAPREFGEPEPAKPAGQNKAEDWIAYHNRHGQSGPSLSVLLEGDEKPTAYPATAAAPIIAYLPDRRLAAMPYLGIDMDRLTCVLLRFDPQVKGKVRKAELVLQLFGGEHPTPSVPFTLGFYELKEAWDEAKVSWATQPASAERPAQTVEVDPKAKEVRLDVTKLVQRLTEKDAPRHGWLLAVATPVNAVSLVRDGPPVEAALARHCPWEKSVAGALKRAGEEKKLVLACARASDRPEDATFAEKMLRLTALADPDVAALVRERFIPVRVHYSPVAYLRAEANEPGDPDPLAALGGSVKAAKGLALVVSEPDGSVVAMLGNIGTFDRDLVLRLLLDSLGKARLPAEEKDLWKLLRRGDLDEAEKRFTAMGGREGKYGLSRVASYRGDHAAALRLAEPLAGSEGAFRHEAQVQAGQALLRLGRFADAAKMLQQVAEGPTGSRSAEADFDLGRLLFRLGEPARARAAWQDVVSRHPDSLSAVTARARLVWTDALAGYDNLQALDVNGLPGQTEVDRSRDAAKCVERGIDYLLSQQSPEGSWSEAQSDVHRVAITALAARSLHLWGLTLEGERKERMLAAAARATRWLDGQIKSVEPRTFDSFGAAYVLDYFVDLEETKAAVKGDVKAAIELLLAGQCPGGGWSYNYRFAVSWKGGGPWPKTDKGREHSMNTGPALLALARAKALGYEVPAKAQGDGRKALEGMRDKAGVYTYTYPEPRCFNEPEQSIARAPVCEHALQRLGGSSKEEMEATLALFMTYRRNLRSVAKLTESWFGPRCYSSYFYFFAYDHAARAIAEHKEGAKDRLRELRDDLLGIVELDGTWVDYEPIGKPYGTAMALHVLYLAR